MMNPLITIITPTTGKKSLYNLIESLNKQIMSFDSKPITFEHILLWDEKREDDFLYPDETLNPRNPLIEFSNDNNSDSVMRYNIIIPGRTVRGSAVGSALRSIGLMAAQGQYVTFMDDDVFLDLNHLSSLMNVVQGHKWAYTVRKIWTGNEYLGIDEFESVGDSPNRKVPYEMVDNNCMIFERRLGTSGAVLYRETTEYNDDRQFYSFLKQYGGIPGKTNIPTINQICPTRLIDFFRNNCTK